MKTKPTLLRQFSGVSLSIATLFTGVFFGVPVLAEEDAFMEEITVRATRRDRSLLEVEASVSVLSEEMIENAGITELEEYARVIPNLNYTSRGNRRDQDLTIRGVAAQTGNAGSYGLVIDELNTTPFNNVTFNNPALNDVEQIEVLRGPQGTFFGRSITAGVINIRTRRPGNELTGYFSAEGATDDYRRVRGGVTVPLLDQVLSARISGFHEEDGGFINAIGSDVTNDFSETGGRLAIAFTPSDTLTVDGSISYWEGESGIGNLIPLGETIPQVQGFVDSIALGVTQVVPTFGGLPASASEFLESVGAQTYPDTADTILVDEDFLEENENLIGNLKFDLDLGNVRLIGVVGHLDLENNLNYEEADFGPGIYPFEATGLAPIGLPATLAVDTDVESVFTVESTSLELRLQSDGDGALDWVVGVFASDDESRDVSTTFLGIVMDVPGVGPLNPLVAVPPGTVSGFADITDSIESRAIFGDLTWQVTERLTLGVGARYSSDDFSTLEASPNGATMLQEDTFNELTPRFSIGYRLADQVNVYALASKGYRFGGFNPAPFPPTYNSEFLWNYEVGMKGIFADGKVDLRAALFYMDWTDIQVSVFDVALFNSFNENAAEASSQGFELEAFVFPTAELSLSFGIGYTDATYDSYQNANVIGIGGGFDLSGSDIRRSPEWNFSAAAEYRSVFANNVEWFIRGEYQYVDEQTQFNGAAFLGAYNLIDSYDVVNLRGGFEINDWSVLAYAENVGDDQYQVGANGGIFVTGYQAAVTEGLRAGVQVTRRF